MATSNKLTAAATAAANKAKNAAATAAANKAKNAAATAAADKSQQMGAAATAAADKSQQMGAAAAAAANKAKNAAAIQAPVNTSPPPNLDKLQKVAPKLAAEIAGKSAAQRPPTPPRPIEPARPLTGGPMPLQPTPPRPIEPARPLTGGPMPLQPTPPRPMFGEEQQQQMAQQAAQQQALQQVMQRQYAQPGQDYRTMSPQQMDQMRGLGQQMDQMRGLGQQPFMGQAPQQLFGQPNPYLAQIEQQQIAQQAAQQQALQQAMQRNQFQGFAQPSLASVPQLLQQQQALQQANMMGPGSFGVPTRGLGQQPRVIAQKGSPMTGLGAFSANPNIAAANPFAGLGVTAGAQQVQQNVQPPYSPQMDTFRGDRQQPSGFGQPMGQLFGIGQAMGQPQTQQSPYAQQQASNLMQQQQYSLGQPQNSNPMQNAGQFGASAYGSFVGQQNPQRSSMQQSPQNTQQNNQSTQQGSVAPPAQAGFNLFSQGQDQGNTGGGGAMGGGGLF